MASMIFSDDEARFIRLALKLAERAHDDKRASWMPYGSQFPSKTKAVGEFRILVIGGHSVGKTSLLSKVRVSLEWPLYILPSTESDTSSPRAHSPTQPP